ncbi:YncE family protein [Shewanella sp. D64]|uniref:YncE family protein n=1 Tax=unclassified Shewanella TaxID=196818 RepID=UPI0022BA6D02|nr:MULTISPECIES: YncE family protein [unclassified Shewanella]MEC4726633.1 YncE family protein [Shewanella sp. D64]MEC4739003.1 YncE family protein [Shewanella sp. E94]WBJ96850.1 YncE family protein [Shewanella sp. MTB7]
MKKNNVYIFNLENKYYLIPNIIVLTTLLFLLLASIQTARALTRNGIAYMPIPKTNQVQVYDFKTHTVLKTINNVGTRPIVIKALPDRSKVYVDNFGPFSNDFTVIDTATDSVIKKIKTSGTPWAAMEMSSDGRYFYIPTTNNVVQVVDTRIDEIVATWNINGTPSSILLNQNDTELYVFYVNNTVEAYSTATGQVIKPSISIQGLVAGWATSNPQGTKIYTINTLSDDVSVIDVNSWSVTKVIKLGFGHFPISATVKPGTSDLYVVNTGTYRPLASISVIDMNSDTIVGEVDVAESAVHISFRGRGNKAYLSTIGPQSANWTGTRFIFHSLFYFINTGYGSAIEFDTSGRLPIRTNRQTLFNSAPIAGAYFFKNDPVW